MPFSKPFRLPRDHAAFDPMTSIAKMAIVAVTVALFLGVPLMALQGQRDLAVVFALATPLGLSAWGFARAGHAEPALLLLSLVLITVATFVLMLSPLGAHDVAVIAYAGVVLLGTMLVSRRSFYGLMAVTLISAVGIFVLDLNGMTHSVIWRQARASQLIELLMLLAVIAVPGRYAAEVLVGSLSHTHRATFWDALTGLANRAGFMSQGAQRLKAAHGEPGCGVLVIADLTNFRRVNVVIGHAAADNVLCEVARRLRVASGEHLVARIGDDEFAILALGLAGEEAAAQFVRSVQNEVSFEFSGVSVRSCVGSARSPRDAVGLEGLLVAAEESLARAKQQPPEQAAAPLQRA